jgi:RHS repeat-associated protein
VLRWKWDPSPFGDGGGLVENPGGAAVFKYNLRLPGQYFDNESNLNYNYFRDYDPAVGRYAESDPIGLQGGINTFGYANQQPTLKVDPSGRFAPPGLEPVSAGLTVSFWGGYAIGTIGYNGFQGQIQALTVANRSGHRLKKDLGLGVSSLPRIGGRLLRLNDLCLLMT